MWGDEIVSYKQARRGSAAEDRPATGGKNRKPRKWKVVGPLFGGKEHVWHRAATKELCEQWVEKYARSYFAPRHLNEIQLQEQRQRQIDRAARLRIVSPE